MIGSIIFELINSMLQWHWLVNSTIHSLVSLLGTDLILVHINNIVFKGTHSDWDEEQELENVVFWWLVLLSKS